jgi:hypothetical protein
MFTSEGVDYSALDAKDPETLTEEEKVALLGRPCLGTNPKVTIRIKESMEFKVTNSLQSFIIILFTSLIKKYIKDNL